MYAEEAEDVLVPLVSMFADRWDEVTFASWCAEISTLPDMAAAKRATRAVIREWKRDSLPPFGVWLDYYRAEARNAAPTPALPTQTATDIERGREWTQRLRRQVEALRSIDEHDHRPGRVCPVCSQHSRCTAGLCPRCREISQIQ